MNRILEMGKFKVDMIKYSTASITEIKYEDQVLLIDTIDIDNLAELLKIAYNN